MTRFAENTSVSSEQSRADIERELRRYGADQFMYGWEAERAMVRFRAHGRYVGFELPMPDRKDFLYTPAKRLRRSESEVEKHFEQAGRARWRALLLVIKAKLEAVETGITTFEQEFLAHTLLPDGQTVGQWIGPQVEKAYETGSMPALLPAAGESSG